MVIDCFSASVKSKAGQDPFRGWYSAAKITHLIEFQMCSPLVQVVAVLPHLILFVAVVLGDRVENRSELKGLVK